MDFHMLTLDDSQFLIHLMDAAQGAQPQQAVLSTLAQALQADGATLFADAMVWTRDGAAQAGAPPWLAGLRPGRVYGADELDGRGPLPAPHMRVLGLVLPDRARAWVVLTRARKPFQASDSARLSAYGPHIAQALGLAQRLAQARQVAQTHALAARRMGVGQVQRAADDTLRPDAVANDLLAAHGVSLTQLAVLWPKAAQGLIAVTPKLELLAQGDHALLRAQSHPLAPPETLAQALGLTLAEARFARALAMGETLTDAGRSLGLTEPTARFYSKQIYAKIGLSGQAALMRRVWGSAIALLR
jgi:DNA-binding CsgD family transcriptional regulator